MVKPNVKVENNFKTLITNFDKKILSTRSPSSLFHIFPIIITTLLAFLSPPPSPVPLFLFPLPFFIFDDNATEDREKEEGVCPRPGSQKTVCFLPSKEDHQ